MTTVNSAGNMGKPLSAPLNFTPGGNPLLGAMTGVGGLAGQYALSYKSALDTNQQNYNNIVDLYRTTLENVGNTLGQGGDWGIATPAAQAIADLYKASSGALMSNSIDRGLGQTTQSTAAQRGASFDAAKSYAGLGANLAQSFAGYQSGLGQGLAGILNSVQAPYPDAGAYNQLFGNLMGFQQAQQARQDQMAAASLGRIMAGGGGGVNVIGAGGRGVPPVNTGGGQKGYVSPIGAGGGGGGTMGMSYTPYGNTGVSFANTNPLGGIAPNNNYTPFSGGYSASPYSSPFQIGGTPGYVAAPSAGSGFSGSVGVYDDPYGSYGLGGGGDF